MSSKTITTTTTCKDALRAWKEKMKQDPTTATYINLEYQRPPIHRIGASVKTLANCEVLNLANNMIEKITLLSTLKNLRVLNLSRNNLKTLNGVQCLAKTLEGLWVSYNEISNLRPIQALTNLKVFYVSHNNVREWSEFNRLIIPAHLKELSFLGNPLQETMTEDRFRREVAKRLPDLVKLDFVPIQRTGFIV